VKATPPELPSVTVVTVAYNEERVIGENITNKLEADYPPEKLDMLVVSDGSTDATDLVVQGLADITPSGCASCARSRARARPRG